MLTFRREDRERVARGEITVTFRLWKSAKVRAGKTYRSGFGTIAVDAVDVIPAALVSKRDVRPSGCDSVQAIWESAGEHTGTRVGPDTLLHRVQFRFLGDVRPDSAPGRALDPNAVVTRLAKMDRLSARGPWTVEVLRIIERSPHVPARILAAELDWERLDFKAHVRRLKALGLTISHEIGYEISDQGKRVLAAASGLPAAGAPRSPRTRPRSR
jgi:hypothetical protein